MRRPVMRLISPAHSVSKVAVDPCRESVDGSPSNVLGLSFPLSINVLAEDRSTDPSILWR